MNAVKSIGEFIVVDHNKLAVKSKIRRLSTIKEKLQGP
jgi:hypothetical protein